MDRAVDIATRLATGPQDAVRLTKHALNNWLRLAGPTFDVSAAYEMLTFHGAGRRRRIGRDLGQTAALASRRGMSAGQESAGPTDDGYEPVGTA
jgi:hypothetical protein